MERQSTRQMMETARLSGVPFVSCMVLCLFWIPALFFAGAANVTDTCEAANFATWMTIFGLVPFFFGSIFLELLQSSCAWVGGSENFKNSPRIHGVAMLVTGGLVIWGWVEYSKTSESKCVGDGGVNPRTLTLVFLILTSICLPCLPCMALRQMASPTDRTQADDLELQLS